MAVCPFALAPSSIIPRPPSTTACIGQVPAKCLCTCACTSRDVHPRAYTGCYTRPGLPLAQSDYVSGVPSPLKSICEPAFVARNSRRIPRSLPFFRLARAAGFGRFLFSRATERRRCCAALSIAATIASENSSHGSIRRRRHRAVNLSRRFFRICKVRRYV